MLPRVRRLSRAADVRAVLRRGRRHAHDLVVVHVRDRHDGAPGRVTAVATRRVGPAVDRNRAKRVLRHAVAEVGVAEGLDVALVARPATVAASTPDVVRALSTLFPGRVGERREVVS